MTEHALYRFYGHDGALLYVGITNNPSNRWKAHSKEKPWWLDVTTVTLERHPDRESVLEAERTAIITEKPLFNVVHNAPGNRVPSGLFDDELGVDWGANPADMPDDCHDDCVKAGITGIYYPFRWHNGKAWYRCANGHSWTCHWGHDHAGMALENFGHNQVDAPPGGHAT